MKVRVVIPTFNERENIGNLVGRIFAHIPGAVVLVVDDNSPDGTAEAVRVLQKQWPDLELLVRTAERGFASAYIAGFRHVLSSQTPGGEAEAILTMDADHSHDPAFIPAMLRQIETCDAVIGSRYTQQGGVDGWELWRRILSRGGNAYIRIVTRMPFHDCTSGFNLIRADLLRKLDLSELASDGYAFLMELKYVMWRSGATVGEVPIIFRRRAGGESKISGHIIREGVRAPWRVRSELSRFRRQRLAAILKRATRAWRNRQTHRT